MSNSKKDIAFLLVEIRFLLLLRHISLFIVHIKFFIRYIIFKYFSPFYGLIFHSLNIVLLCAKA
jgi:hypothetical protein